MSDRTSTVSKTITVTVPLKLEQKGGRKIVLAPAGFMPPPVQFENSLIKALARAHRWRKMIEAARFSSITELANAEGINQSYACRLLRLTLLAPVIVKAILNGTQPRTLQLDDLTKPLPANWDEQIRLVL